MQTSVAIMASTRSAAAPLCPGFAQFIETLVELGFQMNDHAMGALCGLYPIARAWLPTAHPYAPAARRAGPRPYHRR
jgi:hypothetical protein